MTREERLKKLKYLRNPGLEEQEILYNLAKSVETVDAEPFIPEKGVDYFTEDDVQEIIDTVRGIIKDGIDGEKGDKGDQGETGDVGPQGVQGTPGKDGVDGKTPNIDKALQEALSKLPKNEPVDTKAIVKQALEAFQEKYKDDSLKLTELEKRLIRLGGGGASFLSQLQDVLLSSPSNGQVIGYNSTNEKWENITVSGTGDVVGPAIATDGAIARYDTTTGKLIKDSGITIADGATGALSGTNTGDQLMYGTIAVAGQGDLDPSGTGDTLNIVAGTNITITTNPGVNELTINSTGGGGSLTKGIAEVDFGVITTQSDIATVSVADVTVTSTSYPSVSMYALETTDHDPDDYMAEGLIPYVTNVSNGVGFDISVRAPSLSWGKYKVTYQF